MAKLINPTCPCGTGQKYSACCRRFHRGEETPDALTLMRSRFSAFAVGEASYLFRTLHPDHHHRREGEATHVAGIRRAQQSLRYVRLAVLDHNADADDRSAQVLFHAEIYERGKERSFIEASQFSRTEEGWRYKDGILRPLTRAELVAGTWSLATFL